MQNNAYWAKRIATETEKLYDLSLKQYRKELKKAYKSNMADIKSEMLDLYVEISQDSRRSNFYC